MAQLSAYSSTLIQGMNRTGVDATRKADVVRLIRAVHESKLDFRGLHYYDGQYGHTDEPERTSLAHSGYDRLVDLVSEIERSGFQVPEIVTSGTPTFPCSLTSGDSAIPDSCTACLPARSFTAMQQAWRNYRRSTAMLQRQLS